MKQARLEFLSICCAAIFLNTYFLPKLLVAYGSYLIAYFGIGPSLFRTALFLNGSVIAVVDLLSIVFFCLNIYYRLYEKKRFDRQFAINLLLMPVPVVFFFVSLPTLISIGLPAL